jgi:hypothetical protein
MNEKEEAENIVKELCNIKEWIEKHRDSDTLVVSKLVKIGKEIEIKSESEMNGIIFNYYNNIFRGMSSNSVLIWEDTMHSSWNRETITMGIYGFGIRPRKQAKPIETIENLRILESHLGEVVKGLNARRKWKKAEELEKFFEIAKIGKSGDGRIIYKHELKNPITCVALSGYHNDIKLLKLNKFLFEYFGKTRGSASLTNDEGSGISLPDFIEEKVEFNSYPGILANSLVSDIIPELIEGFKKTFADLNIQQQEIINKLDKEFGKYLVMNNL